MNEKIVRNAINNFISQDNSLNSDVLKESMEQFLWKSIRQLRKEDPFLYEEIRDLSTLTQTQLLEQRLTMEFVDLPKVVEVISESVIESFNKSLEINECLGDEYIEEYANSVMDDFFQFLEEDNKLWEQLKSFGKDKTQELFSWIKKVVIGSVPAIGVGGGTWLFKGVLGLGFTQTLIVACILILATGAIDFMLSRGGKVNLQKNQIEAIKAITDVLYSIAKAVKNGTEKVKFMYNLTYKNEEKCYKKAGLDTSQLGFRHLLSMKEDSWFNNLLINTQSLKIDTLKRCYLENFLDRISIFFELYFDCLKKTGDWNQVRSMSDDKFIQMFRVKGGFYPACDQFRDNATKALKSFEDLVDYIYSKTPEKKSQWMLLLNRYLLDMKASKDNLKKDFNDRQNKNQPFVSDKYKRLGKDSDLGNNYLILPRLWN